MKGLLVVFVTLFAAIQAAEKLDVGRPEWVAFKAQFHKQYENVEEEYKRLQILLDNQAKVDQHNLQFDRGLVSYKMKINKYSDKLHSEFVKTMNGFKRASNTSGSPSKPIGASFNESANVLLPRSIDWNLLGAVTEVKDQGECGSSWAFSATGSLEAQHFRYHDELVPLSEQNLIDCSKPCGNCGCDGGNVLDAFRYIKTNNGIDTQESYPYEAIDDKKCRYDPANRGAVISGFIELPAGDENRLEEAVVKIGPISSAMDASHESFQHYGSGIYREPSCSSTNLNHAILIVGYGAEDGIDYWLVKNSWNTTWGEKGYVKLPRHHNNHCGIASETIYPILPYPKTETN